MIDLRLQPSNIVAESRDLRPPFYFLGCLLRTINKYITANDARTSPEYQDQIGYHRSVLVPPDGLTISNGVFFTIRY